MKTLAKIFAVIAVLLVIVFAKEIGRIVGKSTIENFDKGKNESVIENKLLETTKQLNAQLPIMVDNETRADIAMCSGTHLIFKYTMVNLSENEINKDEFENNMKSILVKNQCGNEDVIKLFKVGVQYDFLYYDRDGILITKINISEPDCGL